MKTKVRSWRVTVFVMMTITFAVFVFFLLFTYIFFFNQTKVAVTQSYNQTLEICGENIETTLTSMDTHIRDLLRTVYDEKNLDSDSDIIRYKAYTDCLKTMNSKMSFCNEIDELFIINTKKMMILMQMNDRKNNMVNNMKSLQNYLRGDEVQNTSIGDDSWVIIKLNDMPYFYKAYKMGNYIIGGISSVSNYENLLLRYGKVKSGVVIYYNGEAIYKGGRDWSGELDFLSDDMTGNHEDMWKGSIIFSKYNLRLIDAEILMINEENILNVMDKSVAIAMFAMTLITLLLFMAVTVRFRNMVYRPTNELMAAMKKIENGDFDYRIKAVPTSTEFISLKNSFNKMADDLVNLKIEGYEKQLQMKENELRMLRAQIRPHFYVNAVTTVVSMTYQNRNEDIRRYLKALADFMRYMLKLHSHTVKVSEELNNVRNYLKMQEIKFPDSVEAYIGCDPAVEDRQIPYLILFTVIENAFKHAMDLYETLNIIIQCETVRSENFEGFRIVAEDNGIGFPQEVLDRFGSGEDMGNDDGHIGLSNAFRTLQLMYGRNDLLRLSKAIPKGAHVEIWIPDVIKEEAKFENVGS